MGGTSSTLPPKGFELCRKVNDVVPGFHGFLIDSVMMYNFIQYVELWGGWMIIYDLRERAEYQKDHICHAVWGWDGSDLPGEFKTRLFDETSYVIVVIYDEFGGLTSHVKEFVSTLHQAATTPSVVYFLNESLEVFKRSFPYMMSNYSDRTIALPGPYLPIRGDKKFPFVYVLDEKQLQNAYRWVFRVLHITKVINMGSVQIKSKSKRRGRMFENFVEFGVDDIPKIYECLWNFYDAKTSGNILIIDREGFDFGTQMCGWLILSRPGLNLKVDDVVEYLGRIRPDMEDRYLEAIPDIPPLGSSAPGASPKAPPNGVGSSEEGAVDAGAASPEGRSKSPDSSGKQRSGGAKSPKAKGKQKGKPSTKSGKNGKARNKRES